jgi:hypothetical protein
MNKKLCSSRSLPRRLFLKRMVSAATMAHVAPRLLVAEKKAPHPRVTREVFVKSPGKGTAVMAFAYYTRPKGSSLMSIEQRWSRSDTIDVAYYRYSKDNGRTWTDPERRITGEKRLGGMWRLHPRGGYVDPRTGRFLEIWNEGILPSDDPLEGMRQWNVYYTVSTNGGKTKSPVQQIIHEGKEFNAQHPLPGVYTGKTAVMIGDNACRPMTHKDGSILLPVQISPLGPDGRLSNPGGGYTYLDVAALHGRWQSDRLVWRMSEVIKGDPSRSTRGMDEGTIETLADGRLIMVMRGSNDKKYELPSYRWISYSSDGGWKWTQPEPWTYVDGEVFYSPSACSQLLRHSSGRLYWLGNISKTNPRGNRPRYPFFVGEVDLQSGLLKRESLVVVDDRQPEDDELLTLSNFFAREDRETRQILVHMTRLFAFKDGWVGDAHLYRVPV